MWYYCLLSCYKMSTKRSRHLVSTSFKHDLGCICGCLQWSLVENPSFLLGWFMTRCLLMWWYFYKLLKLDTCYALCLYHNILFMAMQLLFMIYLLLHYLTGSLCECFVIYLRSLLGLHFHGMHFVLSCYPWCLHCQQEENLGDIHKEENFACFGFLGSTFLQGELSPCICSRGVESLWALLCFFVIFLMLLCSFAGHVELLTSSWGDGV